MRCHEKRCWCLAGIERLHQENFVDGERYFIGCLHPLLETLHRVAANGYPFDAAQLEDIGGLIDGCLVSF